jgi:hypothetical protein
MAGEIGWPQICAVCLPQGNFGTLLRLADERPPNLSCDSLSPVQGLLIYHPVPRAYALACILAPLRGFFASSGEIPQISRGSYCDYYGGSIPFRMIGDPSLRAYN